MNKPTLTLLAKTAPYACGRARATLDIAFAAAVFDYQVRYIFLADGVYQLVASKEGEQGLKPHTAALATVDLYGIDKIYVDRNSLVSRGLETAALIDGVELVNEVQLASLLSGPGQILNL